MIEDIWTETGGVSLRMVVLPNGCVRVEFAHGVGGEAFESHVIAPFRRTRFARLLLPVDKLAQERDAAEAKAENIRRDIADATSLADLHHKYGGRWWPKDEAAGGQDE